MRLLLLLLLTSCATAPMPRVVSPTPALKIMPQASPHGLIYYPQAQCYRKLANLLDDYLDANHDSLEGAKRAEIIGVIETLRQAASAASFADARIAVSPVPCVCECVASQQRKLDVGPGHPYTGPSVWPASYVCSTCGKRFELKSSGISCAVGHPFGECCHFGETEVKE